MTRRKGLILAGGTGSRLFPATRAVCKQLLPIYDKPMIYYPLSLLMMAGLRDIAVITTPVDMPAFRRLLGDGSSWGIRLSYIVQPSPDGIAQAYSLAEQFLDGCPSALVLGDNLFWGHGLKEALCAAALSDGRATIFGCRVPDPSQFGVATLDANGRVSGLVEKPRNPVSDIAVTGLYFLDGDAPARAAGVRPSARGEVEITSLLETYLCEERLELQLLGDEIAWLDTGTPASLLEASNYVRTMVERHHQTPGSPDAVAWANGWIDQSQLHHSATLLHKSTYGQMLMQAANRAPISRTETPQHRA